MHPSSQLVSRLASACAVRQDGHGGVSASWVPAPFRVLIAHHQIRWREHRARGAEAQRFRWAVAQLTNRQDLRRKRLYCHRRPKAQVRGCGLGRGIGERRSRARRSQGQARPARVAAIPRISEWLRSNPTNQVGALICSDIGIRAIAKSDAFLRDRSSRRARLRLLRRPGMGASFLQPLSALPRHRTGAQACGGGFFNEIACSRVHDGRGDDGGPDPRR
jgi:hypothetical protein